jgi:hypothetical protein
VQYPEGELALAARFRMGLVVFGWRRPITLVKVVARNDRRRAQSPQCDTANRKMRQPENPRVVCREFLAIYVGFA